MHDAKKRAILRQVYEDNAGLVGAAGRSRPQRLRHGYRWPLTAAGAAALATLAGVASLQTMPEPAAADASRITSSLSELAAEELAPPGALPEAITDPAQAATAPPLEVPAADFTPEAYAALAEQSETSLADLFGLAVRTIVIDPGHGGYDPGTTGPGGLLEKEVTLDIAMRLRERLAAHDNFRILLTREDDRKMMLKERVRFANEAGADLFISLHVNALPDADPLVIETYYFGPQSDSVALTLAERENRGSDYTLGEFRGMVETLNQTLKHQESQRLAAHVQASLLHNIGPRAANHGTLYDAGIKTAPFVVLLGVEMPSVLAEVTTMSNPEEERKLADPAYREEIAGFLEQGIVQYLDTSPNSSPSNPDNAEPRLAGAKRNGLETAEKEAHAQEAG